MQANLNQEISRTEEPSGLQPWGRKRVGHNLRNSTTTTDTKLLTVCRNTPNQLTQSWIRTRCSHHCLVCASTTTQRRTDSENPPPKPSGKPSPLSPGTGNHSCLGIFHFASITALINLFWIYYCYCSVAKSCPTLCDPMDCSTPGFPVLHYFLEFVQTHLKLYFSFNLGSYFTQIRMFGGWEEK